MRFTPVVTLFVIMSIPSAGFAQRPKKPTPNSRRVAAPQPAKQTPSFPSSPPGMGPETALYYYVAMYGLDVNLSDRGSYKGVVDIRSRYARLCWIAVCIVPEPSRGQSQKPGNTYRRI